MRLWSIHPDYFDRLAFGRCWSEGLGGLRTLRGQQQMHKNHPQLIRFKETGRAEEYLSNYLWTIQVARKALLGIKEGTWQTDHLLPWNTCLIPHMTVTKGQLEYEFEWLQQKLYKRSPYKHGGNRVRVTEHGIQANPFFTVIDGPIASWEKIKEENLHVR